MKKYTFFLLLILLTGCAASRKAHVSATPDGKQYVVILSMDAFRWDLAGRSHTPTLDSLARAGTYAEIYPVYPSNTFPSHYAMATGLHPDHHGVVNNNFYDRKAGRKLSVFDAEDVRLPGFWSGEPIWNTAEKQGVRTASFYWVGSEYPIQGCRPSIWKPFDKNVPFSDRADSVIAWLQLPEEVRPHLIMWYMEEPDGVGHRATPDSSATLSTVEHLDRILGDFFAEARRLDIFDQIDFIVLSDHGMATYYPENYVNLNDYLPRDSFDYVFDGVPTLLYPKPTYTDSAYAILKRVPRVTVWRKNEIPEKFVYGKNPRIGDLFVLPDIGTYLQFRPESCPVFAATHGYDNFAPEMEAIFYAAGPSFKQNVELPVMANVNLYLIIARLLDLQPAPNDGDSVVVSTLFR